MTIRSLFLFIHVVSAMGVFGTLAIEGALLLRLHHAAGTTEVREALKGFRLLRVLAPLSVGPMVMSGMYLVRTVWGWYAAWINVGFASLVVAAVAGVTTTVVRVTHLWRADTSLIGESRSTRGNYGLDLVLWVSFVMRMAIFTGIAFLMTVKPGLKESLIGIGAATAGGVVASLAVLVQRLSTAEAASATSLEGDGPRRSPDDGAPDTRYLGAHSLSAVTSTPSQNLLSRVTWYALTVLLLTTVHHVYGAYVYHTPWRLHVAYISGVAAAAIIGSVLVLRRHADDVTDRLAFWAFVGVTLVLPVAAIGLFEGVYNHVLKDVLYLAGASTSLMIRMFPPPAYELPNNAFFEITGVMQVVPASVTGWLLYRLVRSRWGASTSSTDLSITMARRGGVRT